MDRRYGSAQANVERTLLNLDVTPVNLNGQNITGKKRELKSKFLFFIKKLFFLRNWIFSSVLNN